MKSGRLPTSWILFVAAGIFTSGLAFEGLAQPFQLPTANQALFERGGEDKFFVGTVGKPWTSGTFGCVRSEGWQIHEGLDIRCLQRDKRGEPTDPILATAEGQVAYLNSRAALSNFGKYLVLRHRIDGLEVYSVYAHLSEIRDGLKPGQIVKAGAVIGIMGRTANTREGISRERAHLHFELNLFVNDHFPEWYRRTFPGQRNDHEAWNGQNLLGLDAGRILREQRRLGAKFSLLQHLRDETELCRVQVRATNFAWLKRYAPLVQPNSRAESEGLAGYELALNFNAIPFRVIPRAASEMVAKSKYHLLSVNEAEQSKNPCRRLVTKRAGRWELTTQGENALGLLTY
jgi:murein DD-endopeptidase MepM/ murein hydrolase activator NlpD